MNPSAPHTLPLPPLPAMEPIGVPNERTRSDDDTRLQTLAKSRRWALWLLLVGLVLALLATVVWLAGRYEASQMQDALERDVDAAVSSVRTGLMRNVQDLQALQRSGPGSEAWTGHAQVLLGDHREILRIEWRPALARVAVAVDSPFREPVFASFGRERAQSDVNLACEYARRINAPAYSSSYFLPLRDGVGMEVLELCLPAEALSGDGLRGFLLVTYALQEILANFVGAPLVAGREVSFIEADGSRLAVMGSSRRATRVFTARQLLDLPGATLVLRMDSWRAAPDLYPNVMTALVTSMSIALIVVMAVLGKDTRRRLQAEQDLAEALAFRKAMEDSLVTGLRARDLRGRITYVNPAFCQMVGFSADELLGRSGPPPYWPPEFVGEYERRLAIRMAGNAPPRDGFESVFMRKDGSRFNVLIIEAPLINAAGTQTGWMSAFLDISEQRRVEELSRASQERLQATARLATVGEMASLMSHELNQPLAAISSYATGSLNLLRAQDPTPAAPHGPALRDDITGAMQRIAEQAERAGRIIKSVHDFVRRREQERETVQPEALINAVLPLVALQARKLRVNVALDLPDTLPVLHCDRTMVEQVLLNLARNAMQAMDHPQISERELRLSLQAMAGLHGERWLRVEVADRGVGIPPDVARQIFTPFYTTKAEGMGLGLSLCRTVVEQHGGHLTFEARAGGGTLFRFTLPAQ